MVTEVKGLAEEQTALAQNREKRTLVQRGLTSEQLVQVLGNGIANLYQGKSLIITLLGAPGSGKTTLARQLTSLLNTNQIVTDFLQTDDFNTGTRKTRDLAIEAGADPREFKDFALLQEIISKVQAGEEIDAPQYNGADGSAIDRDIRPHHLPSGLQVLLIEGDFPPLERNFEDLRMYWHVPSPVRCENRIVRDTAERGAKNPEEVVESFEKRQGTQFTPITLPSMDESDIVIDTQASRAEGVRRRFLYSHDLYVSGDFVSFLSGK